MQVRWEDRGRSRWRIGSRGEGAHRGKAGGANKVKRLLKLPTKDKGQNKVILSFEKKT